MKKADRYSDALFVGEKMPQSKKLLVLGAGLGQLPAIQQAQQKGYKVIAVSYKSSDIGMQIADMAFQIDTTDQDKILAIAKEHQIDGIMTMATDVAIPSLGRVVDELGLVGPSYQAAHLATNKVAMKKRFLECGVPTANAKFVRTLDEAVKATEALGLPVMLKAIDSSGSRGITKIEEKRQLKDAFQYASDVSRSDLFIVEEFLPGIEFGAQAFVYRGEMGFVYPHNDTVTLPPYSTPIGHSYPVDLDAEQYCQTISVVKSSAKALGLENSLLNADLMMTSEGPKIIEIGARLGATCLPELTTIYSGIDVVDLAIDLAMDNPIELAETQHKQACAALLIRAPVSGVLRSTYIPSEMDANKQIVAIRWDRKPGDHVNAFRVGPDRIGEIIVTGKTWQEAEALCRDIERQLIIEVD